MTNIDEKPASDKDLANKVAKANVIVAKILVSMLFTGWENRTRNDLIENIEKYNRELDLGIKPISSLNTMIRQKLIHQGGTYNGEPFYSVKISTVMMHL